MSMLNYTGIVENAALCSGVHKIVLICLMFDGFVSSSKTNSVRQLPEKKDISEKFQYYVFPFLHSKKIYNLKRILLFLTV